MMYKLTVLGYTAGKMLCESIDETKIYNVQLPGEKSVQEWFAELCNTNNPGDLFVPCILDSYETEAV